MLKISPEKIAIPLQIIFSKSLRQCKYPSSWKNAHVTAIFKKGDTSLPSNYRPISLISCVGKVMERIIYKHVYNHLIQNKLIYQYQSGFLPKHSSVHQLIELYNTILNFRGFRVSLKPRLMTSNEIQNIHIIVVPILKPRI